MAESRSRRFVCKNRIGSSIHHRAGSWEAADTVFTISASPVNLGIHTERFVVKNFIVYIFSQYGQILSRERADPFMLLS
jgi:hypothetical protein